MRFPIKTLGLLAMLAFSSGVKASSNVAFIPAPRTIAPGKAEVVRQLRKLGKEQFAQEKAQKKAYYPDYSFSAKVLLDTNQLFALELQNYWQGGGGTQGAVWPSVFDMTTGKEYDINRLYRVRTASGGLIPELRTLGVQRVNPAEAGISQEELAEWVADSFESDVYIAPTKTGLMVWPKYQLVRPADIAFTWKQLQPYLDKVEAQRLGWRPN